MDPEIEIYTPTSHEAGIPVDEPLSCKLPSELPPPKKYPVLLPKDHRVLRQCPEKILKEIIRSLGLVPGPNIALPYFSLKNNKLPRKICQFETSMLTVLYRFFVSKGNRRYDTLLQCYIVLGLNGKPILQ